MRNLTLVIGLGGTGCAVLDYLQQQFSGSQRGLLAFDAKMSLNQMVPLMQRYADVGWYWQSLPDAVWQSIEQVVVSPGVPLMDEWYEAAQQHGVPVIGDIELFARVAPAPIVAITGTNGKSTVVTLVTEMINAAGKKALLGGNIGVPVLNLLSQPAPDYYVLELSSFQLETTYSLRAKVATILNISEDHLDRHGNMAAYRAAKERIYQGCQHAIRFDAGWDVALPVPETELSVALQAKHNQNNVRAALAITRALDMPIEPMLPVLKCFKGLPHRCQVIDVDSDVVWINDSKATNVGACIAAVEGVATEGDARIILLLGGLSKGQNFDALAQVVLPYVKAVVVYGQDAEAIAAAFQHQVTCVTTLQEAADAAEAMACAGDRVLLAPACASFDQFKSFEARGTHFTRYVQQKMNM